MLFSKLTYLYFNSRSYSNIYSNFAYYIIYTAIFKIFVQSTMQSCPIQVCGRKFPNQQTLLEHVRRRHPNQYQQIANSIAKSVIENEKVQQQQFKQLPKLNKIINSSKQKNKIQYDVSRRSSSKNKNRVGQDKSGIAMIINESRQIVDDSSRKRSNLKRQNSGKQMFKTMMQQQYSSTSGNNKLPQLGINKPKLMKPLLQHTKAKEQMRQTSQFGQGFGVNSAKKQQNKNNAFYTTLPNFGKQINTAGGQKQWKNVSNLEQKKLSISKRKRLSSHQKQSSVSKRKPGSQKDINSNIKAILTSQQLIDLKTKEQDANFTALSGSAKSLNRPVKKFLQKKNSEAKKVIIADIGAKKPKQQSLIQKLGANCSISTDIFLQRTASIKNENIKSLTLPAMSLVQHLYLKNCNISCLNLNNMHNLITLSVCHNQLTNMQFINFSDNSNLIEIYLDYNAITSVKTTKYLQVLSVTFNQIHNLQQTALALKVCSSTLRQLDLSFNPIKKELNYKDQILASLLNFSALHLQKLDGLKVTKMDEDIAFQYKKMLDIQKGIIPLKGIGNNWKQSSPDRPSTAFTTNYENQSEYINVSSQKIQNNISSLEKNIKTLSQHLSLIKKQNYALEQQISVLQQESTQQPNLKVGNSLELYEKLRRQTEILQLLLIMQDADESQIQKLIYKKEVELQNVI